MLTHLRRRHRALGLLAVVALVLGFLAGCGSSDDSATEAGGVTPLTFQLGWLPTVEWGATWDADSKGYYKDAGLDLKWLPGGANVATDTVVTSGKADVGSSSADRVALAVEQGAPLKIIGAAFQKSTYCIVSRAGDPITKPQDMVGKRIGVAAANMTPFKLFLKINGIDPSSLTIVPVQFDPSPVANKDVDGQVVYSINEPTQLEVKGTKTHTMLFEDYGFHVLTDVYFATDETIADHADQLAAFLSATRHGFQDMFADPKAAAKLAVDKYGKDQGLDLAQQTLQAKAMKQVVLPPGTAAPIQLTQSSIDQTLATLKLMDIDVPADKLFDTSVMDKVK